MEFLFRSSFFHFQFFSLLWLFFFIRFVHNAFMTHIDVSVKNTKYYRCRHTLYKIDCFLFGRVVNKFKFRLNKKMVRYAQQSTQLTNYVCISNIYLK